MKTRTWMAVAATCAVLAACGGGGSEGGDSSPTTNSGGSVPQSAQSSVAGLITYLQSLIAGTNDTALPVSLDGVTLPVDDNGPSTPI